MTVNIIADNNRAHMINECNDNIKIYYYDDKNSSRLKGYYPTELVVISKEKRQIWKFNLVLSLIIFVILQFFIIHTWNTSD
jgi:hypothetical protein